MAYFRVNIAHEVTILELGTSSNHGLNMYQDSRKYLERVYSYGTDTFSKLTITNGQRVLERTRFVTDRQTFMGKTMSPPEGGGGET